MEAALIRLIRKQWPVVTLLVFGLVVFWPLWRGQFYASGDMRDVFIPLELFFRAELLHGRLPAWLPEAAWGFPVIAAAQVGFFYPPLLVARLLPIWLYLPLVLMVHLGAVSLGLYTFLRKLGQSQGAAYLGSISFTFSAWLWQHLTHLNIFMSVAWLPWQLLAVKYISRPRPTYRSYVLLALTLALPFLAGQLQIPLLMALFTSAYFLYQQRSHNQPLITSLVTLLLLAIVVLSLISVQLLPTSELLRYSSRGEAGDFNIERANQYSFPLYHLPTTLWPRFFGSDSTYWGKRLEIEYGIFIGTIPLVLSLWFIRRWWTRHRFWVGAVLVAGLLSLGSLSPFRWVGLEPSLWFFSAPARWLLFVSFSLCVLAGYAYDAWRLLPRDNNRWFRNVALGLLVIVLVANIFMLERLALIEAGFARLQMWRPELFSGHAAEYYQEKIVQLADSLRTTSISWRWWPTYLPLVGCALLLFTPRRRQWLLAFTSLELLLIAATTVPFVPWSNILSPPPTVAALPTAVRTGEARFVSLREGGDTGFFLTNPSTRANAQIRQQQRLLLLPLMHTQYQLPGIEWPASLDLQQQTVTRDQMAGESGPLHHLDLARELNIGAVLIPNDVVAPKALTKVAQVEHIGIYTLNDVRPRVSVIDERGAIIAQSSVRSARVAPGHMTVSVTTPTAGRLLIRDTWFPGWRAVVNQVVLPVEQYPPFWQSVSVPAGNSSVELTYRPIVLYSGLAISILSLIALGIVWWWPRIFRDA